MSTVASRVGMDGDLDLPLPLIAVGELLPPLEPLLSCSGCSLPLGKGYTTPVGAAAPDGRLK